MKKSEDNFVEIKSLNQLYKLIGGGKPLHPMVAVMRFTGEEVFDSEDIYRFTPQFYMVVFKDKISGSFKYGRNYYDFEEGTMVYTSPNQVITFGGEQHKASGWVLIFHKDLIRPYNLQQKMEEYSFFSYDSSEALHLSDREKEIIESIIYKIEQELNSNIDDFSEELLVSNIELLLNYSKRFYKRQFITRKQYSSDVIVEFKKMVDRYFESDITLEEGIPPVSFFAEKVHLSSGYLTDLLKKETGKSALEHIHYKIIEIAKTKLLTTNQTISEIAYDLGFEYPQYFSRLFKKKTGISPGNFRKSGA